MITAGTHPIVIRRGDTGTWAFTVQDTDYTDSENPVTVPIDITDWGINGVAKSNQTNVFYDLPIVVTNAAAGQFNFYVDVATSQGLVGIDSGDITSASYEIQVQIPNAAEGGRLETATILTGTVTVVLDLVRPTDSTTVWG